MSAIDTIITGTTVLSIPLMFAAVGEYVAERAGTINISLEAMLLSGAFFGAWGSSATGSGSLGMLIGAGAGLVVGAAHANMSHRLQANTYIVGLTLNVLLLGLTNYLAASNTPTVHGIAALHLPGLTSLPWVGTALFGQPWMAYLLLLAFAGAPWSLARTRWGLEVRAAGEDPRAADVNGVPVNRRRRQTLCICGLLTGLAGAYLSVAEVGAFTPNMSAGRGFIVIAAVIFGGWRLRGTLMGCLLFGFADALRLVLPTVGVQVNSQLLISAPYLVAIATMCIFAQRSRQPEAAGRPFERGAS